MNDFEISRLAHVEALLDDAKRRLAEVEAQNATLKGEYAHLLLKFKETLDFYATASGYDVDIDCGDRARAALRGEQ